MEYGLILTRSDIKGQIDAAIRAEAAGFESVWTTEFFNANGLVRLAAIATATKRVKLGTGSRTHSCVRRCSPRPPRWTSTRSRAAG